MVKAETPPVLNPPLPDLQWQVRQVVANEIGTPIEQVQLASRMVEDLAIDSLDVVEVMLALEETFDVSLSEEHLPRRFFTENATVDALVEAVALNWQTGQPSRPEWYKREGNEPESDVTVEETWECHRLGCTIWRATSGSGVATGTRLISIITRKPFAQTL